MQHSSGQHLGFWRSNAFFLHRCVLLSIFHSIAALVVCQAIRSTLPQIPYRYESGAAVDLVQVGLQGVFGAMTTINMWAVPLGALFVFALLKDIKRTDFVATFFACLPALGLLIATVFFSLLARAWAYQLSDSSVFDPQVQLNMADKVATDGVYQVAVVVMVHFSILGCAYFASVAWGLLESSHQRRIARG